MRSFWVVAAAAVFSTTAWAADVESVMLMYQAHEPGIEPYASRILVTERYVRDPAKGDHAKAANAAGTA